ncbi:hypothetical protein CCM_07951 [Cordyceps militaris CM01]|uniref:Rhodopsin domain-containing protein n=1 Tax=Cordyceps militaris (strain CM01) TaxID=983644 RepID=G3JP89_CORMM|nr:uncharacterized protein CCM_07951 [Cordyceps militaris CM01]EGX89699.1 hypothetical protein CCM_07951 [Cordyceps militaris CM01]
MPAVVGIPSSFGAAIPAATPWPFTTAYSRVNITETAWPHCAQQCPSFDEACLCEIQTKRTIDHCVLGSCGMPEAICTTTGRSQLLPSSACLPANFPSPVTRNMTETACGTPVRSQTTKLKTMTIAMTPVTILFVTLRLSYKHFFSAPLPLTYKNFFSAPLRTTYEQFSSASRHIHSEEWTFIAASIVGLSALAVILFGITSNGMGTDVWGLDLPTLVAFRQYFVAIQVCYVVLMLLLKTTCALFYLNIFFGRRIRTVIWATVIVHVAITTVCTLVIIFQCVPIRYQWDKLEHIHDASVSGRCININAAAWVNSTFSVASDLWLLAIPMSQLHKLQLHWKKKVGAVLMFMAGITVTVVSCLRLKSVQYYSSTSNPTWDQFDIMYWSTVEIEVGFICSTLPAIRLLLVRFAPRIFGSQASNPAYVEIHPRANLEQQTGLFDDDGPPRPKPPPTPTTTSTEAILKPPERVLDTTRKRADVDDFMPTVYSFEGRPMGLRLARAKLPNNWRYSLP